MHGGLNLKHRKIVQNYECGKAQIRTECCLKKCPVRRKTNAPVPSANALHNNFQIYIRNDFLHVGE